MVLGAELVPTHKYLTFETGVDDVDVDDNDDDDEGQTERALSFQRNSSSSSSFSPVEQVPSELSINGV